MNVLKSEQVTNYFGKWPSFHDAEIINISLTRNDQCLKLKIHVFDYSDKVDSTGKYAIKKSGLITFCLNGVSDINIDGEFNDQNVIASLDIQAMENHTKKVSISPIFGPGIKAICKDVIVESIQPDKP